MSRELHDRSPQAVQDCHELLAWILPHLDKFPRLRRFTLGERIEFGLLEVPGYQVWPRGRRLRPLNGYRFRRRLRGMARAFAAGRVSLDDLRPRIASWIGHAQHADTAGLRRAMFAQTVFSKGRAG